jgi:hypothetical protein
VGYAARIYYQENLKNFSSDKLEGLEHFGASERIILKWVFKKRAI